MYAIARCGTDITLCAADGTSGDRLEGQGEKLERVTAWKVEEGSHRHAGPQG